MTKIAEILSDSSDLASRKDYIKNFSKRMLKTQLFMGSYQEKRFVEPLNSYRDVVKIDSDEKEFIENIKAVKKKLKRELASSSPSPTWIGITDPDTLGAPVGYHLWVTLPIEVFGKYWFKVKTVEFLSNEVRLKLEVVRPLKNEKSCSDISEAEENQSFDLKTTVHNLSNNLKNNISSWCKENVTLANIKDSVIFLSLLVGTIIAGGTNIIKYLMEYLLKLMKELSGFVKVSTPIIISCINMVGQMIYGLYALIASFRQPRLTYQPVSYVNPSRMSGYSDPRQRYNQYVRQRGLPSKSSVIITPLDD